MNKKIMLLMLMSFLSVPVVRIETRPPLMIEDGTETKDDLTFDYFMTAENLPVSAPSTEKNSGFKVLCQSIGLMIFMKILDFANWCQRSCKTVLESFSRYTTSKS